MVQLKIYEFLEKEEQPHRGCGRQCRTIWCDWCPICGAPIAHKALREDCKQPRFYCGYGGRRPCPNCYQEEE